MKGPCCCQQRLSITYIMHSLIGCSPMAASSTASLAARPCGTNYPCLLPNPTARSVQDSVDSFRWAVRSSSCALDRSHVEDQLTSCDSAADLNGSLDSPLPSRVAPWCKAPAPAASDTCVTAPSPAALATQEWGQELPLLSLPLTLCHNSWQQLTSCTSIARRSCIPTHTSAPAP